MLFTEEDLAEFIAKTLRLFFGRVIHWHHVGRDLLRPLNRWINAGKKDELAVLCDHFLPICGNRVFYVKSPGIWTRSLDAQCEMVRIGEIFVERNIRDGAFVLLYEFDVGDPDLRLAFDYGGRYRRQGFDEQRLLFGQTPHILAPFPSHEFFQVPEKLGGRRVPGGIGNADLALPFRV